MPYVQGFLNVRSSGHPDNELPGGGHADNSLPGMGGIDNSLPQPPPGMWPPPSLGNPIVEIDNTLPVQPGTIWPSPGRPNRPDNSLPGGGRPENSLPGRPSRPDNSLPNAPARPDAGLPSGGGGQIDNGLPSKTYWMIAYCPSLGWRYIAVDPSLSVGNELPPTAQPK